MLVKAQLCAVIVDNKDRESTAIERTFVGFLNQRNIAMTC